MCKPKRKKIDVTVENKPYKSGKCKTYVILYKLKFRSYKDKQRYIG